MGKYTEWLGKEIAEVSEGKKEGRGKLIENGQTGCAGKLFRNDSRIIQDEPILSNFSLRFVDKTLMNR